MHTWKKVSNISMIFNQHYDWWTSITILNKHKSERFGWLSLATIIVRQNLMPKFLLSNCFICYYSPMVGMVVTISPSFNLYKMVVFPAASNPTINILISFLPKKLLNKLLNVKPILTQKIYINSKNLQMKIMFDTLYEIQDNATDVKDELSCTITCKI